MKGICHLRAKLCMIESAFWDFGGEIEKRIIESAFWDFGEEIEKRKKKIMFHRRLGRSLLV